MLTAALGPFSRNRISLLYCSIAERFIRGLRLEEGIALCVIFRKAPDVLAFFFFFLSRFYVNGRKCRSHKVLLFPDKMENVLTNTGYIKKWVAVVHVFLVCATSVRLSF